MWYSEFLPDASVLRSFDMRFSSSRYVKYESSPSPRICYTADARAISVPEDPTALSNPILRTGP